MPTQSAQVKLILIAVALGLAASVTFGDSPIRQRPAQQLDDSSSLERQFHALSSMPQVDVTYNKFGRVTYIAGDTGLVLTEPTRFRTGDRADEVLVLLKDVLLATGRETVTLRSNEVWVGTIRTIKIGQTIRGLPVLGGVLSLTVDSQTGRITEVNTQFLPDVGLPHEPQISADDAIAAVRKNLVDAGFAVEGTVAVDTTPSLAYVARPTDDERPKLVWRVQTQYMQPDDELRHVEIWVNAVNGSIVQVDEPTRAALSRTVYTAHNHAPPPADSGLPAGLTQISVSFESYSQAAVWARAMGADAGRGAWSGTSTTTILACKGCWQRRQSEAADRRHHRRYGTADRMAELMAQSGNENGNSETTRVSGREGERITSLR